MNVSNQTKKTLLIGIGNDGRSDDALGWRFVDSFTSNKDQFTVEYRYQLQIEDALLISEYEKVIFVDASRKTYKKGWQFYKCIPVHQETFTSHSLNPETVLWLAGYLFNHSPEAYMMAIEGAHWELRHGLSELAKRNLENALALFNEYMKGNNAIDSLKSFQNN